MLICYVGDLCYVYLLYVFVSWTFTFPVKHVVLMTLPTNGPRLLTVDCTFNIADVTYHLCLSGVLIDYKNVLPVWRACENIGNSLLNSSILPTMCYYC
ncbi:hypothetical protein LSH36_18g02000 [Paralvinella palmiformis]|uniref:Uncharacterized protein n=1 Tax=Paralvinella palmiformis TaxID=53620 RepID=A0AAD9KD49_9ANNE|nr:hypothetical protein LSH36_18g02000 [Paralvinella palmiformis]